MSGLVDQEITNGMYRSETFPVTLGTLEEKETQHSILPSLCFFSSGWRVLLFPVKQDGHRGAASDASYHQAKAGKSFPPLESRPISLDLAQAQALTFGS